MDKSTVHCFYDIQLFQCPVPHPFPITLSFPFFPPPSPLPGAAVCPNHYLAIASNDLMSQFTNSTWPTVKKSK